MIPLRNASSSDSSLLEFPSYFKNGLDSRTFITPQLTQDQLINNQRDEEEANRINRTDKLISQLPKFMRANGYPMGATFMSHWLQGDPHSSIGIETKTVSWSWLKNFKRVNDSLSSIHDTVTRIEGDFISKGGFFKPTPPTAESYRKLHQFLEKSKKQIRLSGASNEYKFYTGSRVISYTGETELIIDDDLSVAMGRFPLKVHLKGHFGKLDHDKRAYPFIFSSYEVSVTDSYDFGEKNEPFWKNQPLGKWGSNGMLDPKGTVLWNSSFRDYSERNGKGKNFDVKSNQPFVRELNKPTKIFLTPGYQTATY